MSIIIHGALINFIFKNIAILLGLAITIVTARLGTEQRGIFTLFTLIASIYIISFSGLGTSIAYRISRHKENPGDLITSALIFGSAIGIIGSVLLLVVSSFNLSEIFNRLWILSVAMPFILFIPYINGVYLGQGHMFPLNINTIMPPIFTITLFLIISINESSLKVDGVLYAWVGGQIIAAVIATSWILTKITSSTPNLTCIFKQLPFSAQVGATNLMGLLNYRIDLFLVQFFLGLSATGIYSIAIVIAEMLWFVSSSITTAAYSRIGASERTNSSELVVRIMHLNIVLLAIISPFLFIAAYFGIPLLFGSVYKEAILPFVILLPGVMIYSAASSLSAYFTNNLGRPSLSIIIALFSLTINVSLSILLIPMIGIIGGAMATSVSYILTIIVSLLMFLKLSGLHSSNILKPRYKQIINDINSVFELFKNKMAIFNR